LLWLQFNHPRILKIAPQKMTVTSSVGEDDKEACVGDGISGEQTKDDAEPDVGIIWAVSIEFSN
jgi:hypothetical protein